MLKKFDFYLLSHLAKTSIGVLIFLLIIDFIVQFSGELEGDEGFSLLLQLLLLDLPEKILLFLPAGILVGSIMGLGQLAKENELMVVLAAGVNKFRIAWAGLFFALFLGLMVLMSIEYFAPQIAQRQQKIKQLMGKESHSDIWLRDKNYLVNIQELLANGQIGGIHLYRLDEPSILVLKAKSASYQNHHWQLHEPQQFQVNDTGVISAQAISIWENSASPEHLQQFIQSSNMRTIQQLWKMISFLEHNGIHAQAEALQLWQRLFLPLTNVVMILLALPFVFGNQRHSAQGTRLVMGIILGIGYYLIQTMLANLALLLGWLPLLGALLPNFIFACGAFLFLRNT